MGREERYREMYESRWEAEAPAKSAIRYLIGDATRPVGVGPKVIAHIGNDIGAWGAGFTKAISARWPGPEEQFRMLNHQGRGYRLGSVHYCWVEEGLWVATMVAQHDLITHMEDGEPPIRYGALQTALENVALLCATLHATLHMPRIGTGLAGGRWDRVESLIDHHVIRFGVPVTVYDLPQSKRPR